MLTGFTLCHELSNFAKLKFDLMKNSYTSLLDQFIVVCVFFPLTLSLFSQSAIERSFVAFKPLLYRLKTIRVSDLYNTGTHSNTEPNTLLYQISVYFEIHSAKKNVSKIWNSSDTCAFGWVLDTLHSVSSFWWDEYATYTMYIEKIRW